MRPANDAHTYIIGSKLHNKRPDLTADILVEQDILDKEDWYFSIQYDESTTSYKLQPIKDYQCASVKVAAPMEVQAGDTILASSVAIKVANLTPETIELLVQGPHPIRSALVASL